jgi:hypothetical protein
VKTINETQLVEILAAVKGAQPVTISALVDAKARKTGNPFRSIRKLSKVNGFTGADYEASVNRQLDREGKGQLSFTANERKWGERVGPALVKKDDKFYLVIQPQNTAKPVYFGEQADGMLRHVSKDTIAAFLPPVRHAENQGTDKEIVYRNYSVANIAAISIGGTRYRVRHETPAPSKPAPMSKTVGKSVCKPDLIDKLNRKREIAQDAAQIYDEACKAECESPEGWDGHKTD